MVILKPVAVKKSVDKACTVCYFEHCKPVLFHIRGAIAWPDGDLQGFAFIAGMEVEGHNKAVMAFDEFEFWTIDHLIDEDGKFIQTGLCWFLNEMWSKYQVQSYFVYQPLDLRKRWETRTYESEMIQPKPYLISIPEIDQVGDRLVSEYINVGRFHGDGDSVLRRHYEEYISNPSLKTPRMGVHALKLMICGMEKDPYVKPTISRRASWAV